MSALCYHDLDKEDQCQDCGLVMYEDSPRTALLTKLREGVEGLDKRIVNVSLLEQYTVNREFVCLEEVLALLEKAGE